MYYSITPNLCESIETCIYSYQTGANVDNIMFYKWNLPLNLNLTDGKDHTIAITDIINYVHL